MVNRLFAVLLLALLGGCAHEEDATPKPVEPVYYTLKKSEPVQNQAPLPNQVNVVVNWKMSDGTEQAVHGFRGWDVDHDGRFDALEALDASGQTTSWAFDFNGDGRVDAVQVAESGAH